MKKVMSFIFAIAVFLSCAISAFAVDARDGIHGIVAAGEPIGTLADEDGILIENGMARASGLPFTMTAVRVSNLLTTYSSSGKNFTGGAFDAFENEGLLIEGTVTHSLGMNVKVGACYYTATDDTFHTVYPYTFNSGVESSVFIPKSYGKIIYFYNQSTYYGHITNHNGSGTVSGTLNFSVSTSELS